MTVLFPLHIHARISDAVEKGKSLADAEALVVGLAQFCDLSVVAAARLREPGCRAEAIGDAVVADRDVGFGPLDDLDRVAAGQQRQKSDQDRARTGPQRPQPTLAANADLSPRGM